MGNRNSCSRSRSVFDRRKNPKLIYEVHEINPNEIVKAQRTVLNVLTETDKECIRKVKEKIMREPQFFWGICELRMILEEITLILQAGEYGHKVECFIENDKFRMGFLERTTIISNVHEINPHGIVKAQRTVLNVLTETDKECIRKVKEKIMWEPQFVLGNCELRMILEGITLTLQAGECGYKVECFIEDDEFHMNFSERIEICVPEINPQEIAKSHRELNVLTEADKECIGEVEENIIKEPQHVLKSCELRIYLNNVTLILKAGKCKNRVECFFLGNIFHMNFTETSWEKIWHDFWKKVSSGASALKSHVILLIPFRRHSRLSKG